MIHNFNREKKINTKNIKTILEFPSLKTLRNMRAFLGVTGLFRKFIKDCEK